MLIRSQDKKRLINLDTVTNFQVRDTKIDANFNYMDGYEVIANYSSEAKAIKVLDMIEKEYAEHLYTNGGMSATSNVVFQPFGFIPPKVFQMPQDSEVSE